LWEALPIFAQSVDDSLVKIGVKPLPPSRSTIRISSWMGGDRDGNPNVTHATTRDVIVLHRFRAADLYHKAIDELSVRDTRARVCRRAICNLSMGALQRSLILPVLMLLSFTDLLRVPLCAGCGSCR
jgi:hypothetical protein